MCLKVYSPSCFPHTFCNYSLQALMCDSPSINVNTIKQTQLIIDGAAVASLSRNTLERRTQLTSWRIVGGKYVLMGNKRNNFIDDCEINQFALKKMSLNNTYICECRVFRAIFVLKWCVFGQTHLSGILIAVKKYVFYEANEFICLYSMNIL